MENYKIYPKQFRNSIIPIEKNRCFVIMPFDSSFDFIYGNIKQVLSDNGFICNRVDEISGSKPIMNKILTEIFKAQYIIADLTSLNANVYYELGIVHSFKDSQNIILLMQKGQKIPFDTTHLNHILYDSNNLKLLTSNILQQLSDNSKIYSFSEALQQKGIINIIHENQDEFVTNLQDTFREYIFIITDILMKNESYFSEEIVTELFMKYLSHIRSSINRDYLEGMINLLFELLLSCSQYTISDQITYDILYGKIFITFGLSEQEVLEYRTKYAILLASQNAKINTSMAWLIDYFKKSKSSVIDLNRYKIERFLMITSNDKINEILIDSIRNENNYIREHIADICGEKLLYSASQTLMTQLLSEENIFTATSLIASIGKLSDSKGSITILKWIESHKEEIITTKQFFVLKHSRIAIEKIDIRMNTKDLKEFDAIYYEYIKNYFIL
jgi:hypothetical protein